jgi:hypothetical protein
MQTPSVNFKDVFDSLILTLNPSNSRAVDFNTLAWPSQNRCSLKDSSFRWKTAVACGRYKFVTDSLLKWL